jgi:hypothetical protein
MTTAQDIVSRALKDIGALAPGEPLDPSDAQDALDMLNDMCAQWSNENMMVSYKSEIIFPVVQNQIQYTIGPGGQVGSTFTGSIAGNVLTVNGISKGAINLGQTISGTGVTANTTIVAMNTGAGGNVNEVGTYTVDKYQTVGVTDSLILTEDSLPLLTESDEALEIEGINTITFTGYYQRPLTIESAFVRVTTTSNGAPIYGGGLDYPVQIFSLEEYESIGLKSLNGPWPKGIYYQPSSQLGTIYVWPNPAQGELHLFTETIFRSLTALTDEILLPQGYNMALRWCLAERLMPMFGKVDQTMAAMISTRASEAKSTIKRTNMRPGQIARYPDALMVGKAKDAGFIMDGGFR